MRCLFFPSTREATAQIAAGNQPRIVSWRIKQIIPLNILPLKKKDNQGRSTAISIISIGL
ncbi:MAG: hypothetical protein K0S24_2837 [Sphingobacterium sp.]|nr:hypothetical protein [Sphingobacterium sp.]